MSLFQNTIKARNEVHLLPGFEAHAGSEVHIYIANVHAECPCYHDLTKIATMLQAGNRSSNAEIEPLASKEMELAFKLHKGDFAVSAYPNPSSGEFTVEINSDDEASANYHVIVFSTAGEQVLQKNILQDKFSLDLSKDPPGLYYMKIYNDKHSKIFKLINL